MKSVCEGRKPVPNLPPAKTARKSQADMTNIADMTDIAQYSSYSYESNKSKI